MVRQLAPEDDLPLVDEQAGMLLHDRLQNAPPLYDQLARVMMGTAPRPLR